jgi:hypothetical protein
MRKTLMLAALAAAACGSIASAATYNENFDDGAAAGRFTTVVSDPGRSDYVNDYAFDYSSLGIGVPQAGQVTTKGLKLAANQTGNPTGTGAIAGVNAYVNGLSLTGSAVMTFDVYDYSGATGSSTIYSTYGFYHSTQTGTFNSLGAAVAPATATATSGYWFTTVPDTGSSNNYRALKVAATEGTVANYPAGSVAASNAYYQTLFPANNANQLAGYIHNRWVNVRLTRDADTGLLKEEMKNPTDATWTTIFSINDLTNPQTSGTVTLGMTDPFASLSDVNQFYIYDNLVVTYAVPEPATLTAALAVGGLVMRRRR